MKTLKTYSELSELETFEERFNYLSLTGEVGLRTFGGERYLNQRFYTSTEWRRARNIVIARDNGCDLGIIGHEIHSTLYIHHMNPLTLEDFEEATDNLLDPEFLITTGLRTHNAIHFGDKSQLPRPFVERTPGDTRLWGK